MAKVDFYEAKGSSWDAALCELVEKEYKNGQNIYLWAESDEEAIRFDKLLWTFRDDSFVPHDMRDETTTIANRVVVGSTPGNPNSAQCLVLARNAAPEETAGFARIIDLAPKDVPRLLELARKRYSAFKKAGFQVTFHRAGA